MRARCMLYGCCLTVVAVCSMVFADVINPDYHPVSRCVTVGNLQDYPDISIIGVYSGPVVTKAVAYQVLPDSCLYKGYKFNSLTLSWVFTDYLQQVGIDGLPIDDMYFRGNLAKTKQPGDAASPPPLYGFITSNINPYGEAVPVDSPLVSEELIYNLNRNNFNFTLTLAKTIVHFKDGTTKVVGATTATTKPALLPLAKSSPMIYASLGEGYIVLTPSFTGKAEGMLLNCNGRVVSTFNRNFKGGSTYVVPGKQIGSGVYWLQVHSGTKKITVQLNSFK